MALDATVVRATGKVSLSANVTNSQRFTRGGGWLRITVVGSSPVWFTVVPGATDETAVTPASAETFCAAPNATTFHKVPSSDFVLNMEAEAAVTVGAQCVEL